MDTKEILKGKIDTLGRLILSPTQMQDLGFYDLEKISMDIIVTALENSPGGRYQKNRIDTSRFATEI